MAMKLPIILTVLTLVGFATVGMQDEKITPDAALAELKTVTTITYSIDTNIHMRPSNDNAS
jgi:hypothetical protein